MPYSPDGASVLTVNGCFPIVDDPLPLGQPCTLLGGFGSGLDDCNVGAICWDDDGGGELTCTPLCAGTLDALVCPPGFYCAVYWEQLNICEAPTCDPLQQDCPAPDELCLPNIYVWEDWCLPDDTVEAGQVHEPCEDETGCAAGLLCIAASLAAVECDANAWGCCQPFCELGVDTCAGAGQLCAPWYEITSVGVCRLPHP